MMHLARLLPLLALAAAAPALRDGLAELLIPDDNSTVIPGKYIVKLKDSVGASGSSDVVKTLATEPHLTYDSIFKGFATELDEAGLQALREHPDVDYIEADQQAAASALTVQQKAPWGLTRISHRRRGSPEYVYDNSGGKGVCVYVIDTGVDARHPEFEGRAHQIQSYISGSNIDDNGHGTHVAGTVGSRTYGVAKRVTIFGVKVLAANGFGDNSVIIKGMDFVHSDAQRRQCPNGVVVNMSLGSPSNKAENQAAARLVRDGFFVAVAAGNDNRDARYVSPASEPSVCTVGGTDRFDRRYTQSNWGPALDILGPGVDVVSTLPNGGTGFMTGTSMASPHIAGLGAYLATLYGRRAGPWLCQTMQQLATKNAISDQITGTVNLLAFNGATR
ncbi:putative subtilisin-like protease [Epichloe bromicola]|uniref:Subtilisin-like protease n=1 Tax=Epichloe bromicola TaxID=79588 RepID=A0ABQ0CTE3_9HYPO